MHEADAIVPVSMESDGNGHAKGRRTGRKHVATAVQRTSPAYGRSRIQSPTMTPGTTSTATAIAQKARGLSRKGM